MNKLDKSQKNQIDRYFNEGSSETNPEFEAKLKDSLAVMDIFDDELIEVPNDFFHIIEQAEQINEERSSKKEFILFIFAALAIMLGVGTVAITSDVGFQLILVVIIVISIALPFSLIPISKTVLKRSDV